MARRVREAALESREARRKLKPRGEPYWRAIERTVHLGYRRREDSAGTWAIRIYSGNSYRASRLGVADDLSDADSRTVLSWWQAVDATRTRLAELGMDVADRVARLTVADAMDDYLAFLEANRKSAVDARYRDRALIRPVFGKMAVVELTADKLRRWHSDLTKRAPRLRTRKGETQRYREIGDGDDAKRRRRASANRTLTILKAALNRAWRDGKVPTDNAWRKVEPYENVQAARVRYFTVAEAKRLLNGCDPDFRCLVQAALETGARYSELARLTVADFNPDIGAVAIRVSKGGKSRHVILTTEGQAFFRQLCLGRAGDETMLLKANATTWGASHQIRPMADACKRAKITPPASFHALRHSWASLSVMAGVPLLVVAKNLGHADTRMVERHYGHLAPSYVADAIRRGAPKFGFKPDDDVVPLIEPRW